MPELCRRVGELGRSTRETSCSPAATCTFQGARATGPAQAPKHDNAFLTNPPPACLPACQRIEVHASSGPSALRLPAQPDAPIPFSALPVLLDSEEAAELTPRAREGGRRGAGSLVCRRTMGCTKHAGNQIWAYSS
jgi:hypothetical protein